MKDVKWKGRRRCEQRRNYLLQAISPSLTMFSTAIYLYCVKMRHWLVCRWSLRTRMYKGTVTFMADILLKAT